MQRVHNDNNLLLEDDRDSQEHQMSDYDVLSAHRTYSYKDI